MEKKPNKLKMILGLLIGIILLLIIAFSIIFGRNSINAAQPAENPTINDSTAKR